MKALVLYHPKSDQEGLVQDWLKAYKLHGGAGKDIELVSLESAKGASLAELYGVTRYPATLAIASDGQLHKLWQGDPPLMNELDFYMSH